MTTLKESRLPTISGFTALEEVVQEVRQRETPESSVNNPVDIEGAESDMLHCVTPDLSSQRRFGKGPLDDNYKASFRKMKDIERKLNRNKYILK